LAQERESGPLGPGAWCEPAKGGQGFGSKRVKFIAKAFLLLLIVGAAGAAYLVFDGSKEPPPFAVRTREFVGRAEHVTLEKAADYWLSSAGQVKDGATQGSGTALALAIRLGRAEAAREGVEPVPDELKQAFKAFYPGAVLNKARWIVADPDSRLGRVLARWPVQEGAVTLGDIIVFKTQSAADDRQLFAHELVHVDQYRKLGIDTFARRYAANPDPIEAEAQKKAGRVAGAS
jgi:hypothetical protein